MIAGKTLKHIPKFYSHYRAFSISPESAVYNCLHTGLGFTPENISQLTSVLHSMGNNLVEDCPADIKIPAIWSAMQNHGLCNLKQFQALCLKSPQVAFSSYSNTYSILNHLQEYDILNDTAMDIFIKYPQILLRDEEKIKRILIVMCRSMQCEREYIGKVIRKEPRILLTKVFICIN